LWTAFTIRQEDPKKWDAVPVRNLNLDLFYEIQSIRQRFLLNILGLILYIYIYIYIYIDALGFMLIEIKFRL
jgi:TRAP-type mannitol/chloroaromatic compound transport system permease small subunit